MKKKKKLKLLLEIYITFLKLGTVSFGGGYAIISLMETEVTEKKWVNHSKLVDIFAVAQSLPGAIALNASAFVGFAIAGIPGAIAALLGNLTSPVIIVLTLNLIFTKIKDLPAVKSAFSGIYPTIVALVAYAGYKIGKTSMGDWISAVIAVTALFSSIFLKIGPIPIIVAGAVAGILIIELKSLLKQPNYKDGEKSQ